MAAAAAPDAAPDAAVRFMNMLANPTFSATVRGVMDGDGTRIPNFHSYRSVLTRLQNFLIANNLVSNEPLGQFWWAPIEVDRHTHPMRYTAIIDRPVIPDGWRILGDIVPIGPVLPEEWFVDDDDLWNYLYGPHYGLNDLTYNNSFSSVVINHLCFEIELGDDYSDFTIAFSMILRGYRFP